MKKTLVKTVCRIETLTDAQRAAIPAWNAETIREITSLDPVQMPVFLDALARCVQYANLPMPQVVLAASPFEAWAVMSAYQQRTKTAGKTATRAATETATWAATWAATETATSGATWDATPMMPFDEAYWSGGREWLSWIRFILFFRDMAHLALTPLLWQKGQAYYDLLRAAGSCILHSRGLVVVSQPPIRRETRLVNGRYQLHADGRAAVEYRDGFRLFYLHGVAMPGWVVETPARELDVTRGLALTNAQQRAEFVKKVGIERVMQAMPHTVLHTETIVIGEQAHAYELLSLSVNDVHGCWLKMVNPSVPGLYHIEPVRGTPTTVREALHARKPDWMRRIPIDETNGLDWFQQGDVYIVPDGAARLKSLPTVLT